MRVVALLPLAVLVVASCGGEAPKKRASPECVVKLYFGATTPRARVLAVAARLRRYERVARVQFVSKQAALRLMRKKHPDLMHGIVGNPLPDALTVWPRTDADRDAVLRALRPPPAGVERVGWRRIGVNCG